MMTTIEINDDTLDKLMRDDLGWHLQNVKKDIAAAKKNKKLQDYQMRELAQNVILADALEKVYDYFGGNLT